MQLELLGKSEIREKTFLVKKRIKFIRNILSWQIL